MVIAMDWDEAIRLVRTTMISMFATAKAAMCGVTDR
jgi:hypothetical protein